MKNAVIRDVTPCGSCKKKCFGETYRHKQQGDKNQWARNNVISNCQMKEIAVLQFFLAHWFLSPWWWRRYAPPKRRLLQEPHGVTSQQMAFLINLLFLSRWSHWIFQFKSSFQTQFLLGVYSTSNRNEYPEHSWEVKRGRRARLTTSPPFISCLSMSFQGQSQGYLHFTLRYCIYMRIWHNFKFA
jgi:hypothetical protein